METEKKKPKNPFAVELGRLSVLARKKKWGKDFNQHMKDISKLAPQNYKSHLDSVNS